MTPKVTSHKEAAGTSFDDRDAQARRVSQGAQFTDGRVLFLVLAATVLVYANALGGQFLFDDLKQIVNNPQLRTWANVWHSFTREVWSFQRGIATADAPLPYYRPLFTIYLTIGYQLFGLWEPGWHLLNLLVHAGATVSVYYLARRLSGDRLVAALTALLFGIHPAHVESVSWISGIPDALAALFYLPALIWYVRFRTTGGGRWRALSVVAFALSLLCKEAAITLPLVLVVWELSSGVEARWTARARQAALRLMPYGAVIACYLSVRVAVLGAISWPHPMMARLPGAVIWLTVPRVVLAYLQHLIAPFYLSLNYGIPFASGAGEARFLVPVALLVALSALLWIYRRRVGGPMWLGLALLFAPLLPVLNLRVFHQDYIVQDRYLYLPSVGLCLIAALMLTRLVRGRHHGRRGAIAAAVLLISFSASAVMQNRIWNNGVALWQRAVVYAPHSWAPHYNLGLAYMERKDAAAARAEFLAAAANNPGVATVYNSLALAEDNLGDEASAIADLRRALALDPTLIEAHNNLGTIFFRRGERRAAREQYAQALERDPSSVPLRFNLARAAASLDDYAAAIPLYESVIDRSPGDAEAHYYLGLSYAADGRKPAAIEHIRAALNIERDAGRAAEMRAALENLQNSRQ